MAKFDLVEKKYTCICLLTRQIEHLISLILHAVNVTQPIHQFLSLNLAYPLRTTNNKKSVDTTELTFMSLASNSLGWQLLTKLIMTALTSAPQSQFAASRQAFQGSFPHSHLRMLPKDVQFL